MFAADFRRDNTAGPWQELLDDNNFEEAGMLYAQGVRKWENKVRDKGGRIGNAAGNPARYSGGQV